MRVMIHRIFRPEEYPRIIFFWVIIAWLGSMFIPVLPCTLAAADPSAQVAGSLNAKVLKGQWVRPDGGYILVLQDVVMDGVLTASYFNPQQIRVSEAFWTTVAGELRVFIELRDINYPGSKYNLHYDQATDRLQGTYFQALERQTYEIEFVREK